MCKTQVLLTWLMVVCTSQAAVLDPALYLSPSPPLTGEPRALAEWSGVPAEPLTEPTVEEHLETTDEPEEPQARTFWSSQPSYGVRGIHIPLTFSLTGTYGTSAAPTGIIGSSYGTGLPSGVSGVIGSSYASVSEDLPFGKSGLAGSSYGLYRSGLSGLPGTRVYGGSGSAAWSGWGNGKWGHYGKG